MLEFEADLGTAGLITVTTVGLFTSDVPRSGAGSVDGGPAGVPANQAGALYNYLLIARGGGNGVHNPKYTQQLIYDSIFSLTGKAPVSLPTRPQ
jgi:hypothetical protein